ncbi:hypothetical protein GTW41_29410 [Streptomyces sp. SID4941]|nr:hypothetical protein [Streptomyces sp. SID4941]
MGWRAATKSGLVSFSGEPQVARASNPGGTTAIWVRDRLDGLLCDEDFADWYPRDGRPGPDCHRTRKPPHPADRPPSRTTSTSAGFPG